MMDGASASKKINRSTRVSGEMTSPRGMAEQSTQMGQSTRASGSTTRRVVVAGSIGWTVLPSRGNSGKTASMVSEFLSGATALAMRETS